MLPSLAGASAKPYRNRLLDPDRRHRGKGGIGIGRGITTIGISCLLLFVLGHGRAAGAIDVLVAAVDVMGSNDVVQKLDGTGLFTTVDLVDVSTTTPTLADFQAYEAVLVYSGMEFDDPESLGDNLADYLHAGDPQRAREVWWELYDEYRDTPAESFDLIYTAPGMHGTLVADFEARQEELLDDENLERRFPPCSLRSTCTAT